MIQSLQIPGYMNGVRATVLILFTILLSKYVIKTNVNGFKQACWPPKGVKLWFSYTQRTGNKAKLTSVTYLLAFYFFMGGLIYVTSLASYSKLNQIKALEELRDSIISTKAIDSPNDLL